MCLSGVPYTNVHTPVFHGLKFKMRTQNWLAFEDKTTHDQNSGYSVHGSYTTHIKTSTNYQFHPISPWRPTWISWIITLVNQWLIHGPINLSKNGSAPKRHWTAGHWYTTHQRRDVEAVHAAGGRMFWVNKNSPICWGTLSKNLMTGTPKWIFLYRYLLMLTIFHGPWSIKHGQTKKYWSTSGWPCTACILACRAANGACAQLPWKAWWDWAFFGLGWKVRIMMQNSWRNSSPKWR